MRSMSRSLLALACALALAGGAPTAGAVSSAITGLDILRVPLGARPIGMGGAFTGLADDVNAVAYNPTGLVDLTDVQATFVHSQGLADIRTEFGALGLPSERSGTWGIAAVYRSGSDITNPGTDQGPVRAYDIVAALSWAGSLHAYSGPAHDFRLAATGRLVYSTIGNLSVVQPMLDLAVGYAPADHGFRAGLVVQNLGSTVKFQNEPDTLPITFRLGAAYTIALGRFHRFSIAADVENVYMEGSTRYHLGAEYVLRKIIFLRGGYLMSQNLPSVYGLSLGAGLKFGIYRFDYAYQPLTFAGGVGGGQHTFGLSFLY